MTLPDFADKIDKEDLRPGDVFMKSGPGTEGANGHVAIFNGRANDEHIAYHGIEEAGSTRTVAREISYPYDQDDAFVPYWLKGLWPTWVLADRAPTDCALSRELHRGSGSPAHPATSASTFIELCAHAHPPLTFRCGETDSPMRLCSLNLPGASDRVVWGDFLQPSCAEHGKDAGSADAVQAASPEQR
ncbi:hypothetical protein [Brevibacterium oceani]|uniref:hypothetical protein n=1 Tax=Brevibacterium oceani TaxID=358099 RepID=UPI002811FDAF|nr:hypothetical protein [Brevibacterium oceani]